MGSMSMLLSLLAELKSKHLFQDGKSILHRPVYVEGGCSTGNKHRNTNYKEEVVIISVEDVIKEILITVSHDNESDEDL